MCYFRGLFIAFASAVICSTASASVRIIPASGGEAISADTAANSISPSWTTLGPITIYEKSHGHRTRFKPGTNVTLVLMAPAGFEFNTNAAPSISFTPNRDITAASVVVNAADKLTVTLTVASQSGADRLEIGETAGLQVRPTSVFPLASGNIYRPAGSAGGTAIITGTKRANSSDGGGFNTSNFGTLTEVASTAAALSIHRPPSARAVAGLPFGRQPIISVVDQYGNIGSNVNGLWVYADIFSGAGVLLGNTSAQVVSGYANFTDLAASEASTITLRFTGGTFAPVISEPIVVDVVREVPLLTSLSITTQPSSTVTAGAAFPQQPVLRVLDQYDFLVTNDNSTVVTAARSAGAGDLQGGLMEQAVGGVVTFTSLSHNLANSITLLFTSPDITPDISEVIRVLPGNANILAFETQPGEASVGAPFGVQPVVVTQDQFGNNSNIGLSSNLLVTVALTSGTGPLSGTTTLDIGFDDGDGEIVFTDLAIAAAGTNKQLTVTAPGFVSGISALFTVHGAVQTIAFEPLPDKVFGSAPFEVSASASSGLPVSFSIASGPATLSGNVVTIIGAGTVTVRASQEGNADYDPASYVDQSFSVSKADQTITFAPVTDKIIGAAPFSVSATASSGLPVSIVVLSGPAAISGNTVTITGVGVVDLRAYQPGNANYNAASHVDRSFTVNKADQTISFSPLAAKVFGDAPFEIIATASSQLPVAFGIVSGPATISGNVLTITGAGTVTVRGSQSGNANYNPAPDVNRTFTVAKANQTITFTAVVDKVYGDDPFALEGAASTSLPVTFAILSGPAVLSNGVVTITGAGEVAVRCAQGGSANHNPAAVDQTFLAAKAPLLVVANDISRVQGSANPELTGSITGLKNEDNITATYATTADSSSPVGTYPITVTLIDPDDRLLNYDATIEQGTFTVLLAMPTIIGQTPNIRTNQGCSLTLAINAVGDGLSYQWRFNGEDIAAATDSSISLTHARIHDSGLYQVVVSNGAGSQLSVGCEVEVCLIPGDLDQNGQADVLLQNKDGRLACWYMDGTTLQAAALLRGGRPLNPGWNVAGEHDFTGDGHADVLLRNIDGRIALWIMNGAQFESAIFLNDGRPISLAWKVAGLHDFNGDGSVDILFKNDNGRLVVRFMDRTTFIGSTVLRDGRAVGPGWKVVGIRDFNADGQGDIFFRNVDGRLAVWFMNGTELVSATTLRRGPNVDSGWKLVGLSDFNKDGKIDLMWQNRFDGRVAIWTLDGTTFVNSSLMRVMNPIWRIVGAK